MLLLLPMMIKVQLLIGNVIAAIFSLFASLHVALSQTRHYNHFVSGE